MHVWEKEALVEKCSSNAVKTTFTYDFGPHKMGPQQLTKKNDAEKSH